MLRIGIAGCGRAARIHVGRLVAFDGVSVVGCADPNRAAAEALAGSVPVSEEERPTPFFEDHRDLLARAHPDVMAIFAPHRAHYRLAMDALQAGCHVFIEKPLSTNAQEASDIVNLARARDRVVAVGHQYRLLPGLIEARNRLEAGEIGALRLVTACLASPWLGSHSGPEDSWRQDPRVGGTGILADEGDHLLDALLWTTGRAAAEVAAFQNRRNSGLDVVTAAAIRLADGTPTTLAVCGVAAGPRFELTYFGEQGTLRATDRSLSLEPAGGPAVEITPVGPVTSIDADFIEALTQGRPPCCPADQAIETVRLLEAIGRSATTGQLTRVA